MNTPSITRSGVNQSETPFGRGDLPEIAQAARLQPAISFREIRWFVLGWKRSEGDHSLQAGKVGDGDAPVGGVHEAHSAIAVQGAAHCFPAGAHQAGQFILSHRNDYRVPRLGIRRIGCSQGQ